MQLATRPPAGVAGRDISLLVNHFSLGLRINSSLNVYSVSLTNLTPDSSQGRGFESQDGQNSKQQQKTLPRGLVQRVVQELAGQANWPAGWVLVGQDRLASSGSLCEESESFTVKLLPKSEEATAAAAGGGAGSSGAALLEDVCGSKGGTFKVKPSPPPHPPHPPPRAASHGGWHGTSNRHTHLRCTGTCIYRHTHLQGIVDTARQDI